MSTVAPGSLAGGTVTDGTGSSDPFPEVQPDSVQGITAVPSVEKERHEGGGWTGGEGELFGERLLNRTENSNGEPFDGRKQSKDGKGLVLV
jgi:hypothetical protein